MAASIPAVRAWGAKRGPGSRNLAFFWLLPCIRAWKLWRVVDKPATVAAHIMQLEYSLFFARCRPGAHHNNKGLSACGTATLWRPRCSREPKKTAKSSEWRAAKTRHQPNPFNGDHPKQTLISTRPSHRPHAMWMPSPGFALKMMTLVFTGVRW